MQRKHLLAAFLLVLPATFASAQTAVPAPNELKPGSPAPVLTFNRLLQAPAGSQANWDSLRGKVVVLEFWATWCAPCIAEIPVLNDLQASLDPAKVQVISVDDEDPAVVEGFLKKKPMKGWIGLDTSGKVFERFGVYARPATIVVDPHGRIVSTTVHPENLKPEQLLALANGKQVVLGGRVDPKVQQSLSQAVKQAFAAQAAKATDISHALFSIILTPGDTLPKGKEPDTHEMVSGPGRMDIMNASSRTLLSMATDFPETRIIAPSRLEDRLYNLHVDAPDADAGELSKAIELAISSGANLVIEHHTASEAAYILTAKPEAKMHFTQSANAGAAFYSTKLQALQCINATTGQIASALEAALGTPVVNETGLSGTLMLTLKMAPKDLSSAKTALASLGLDLTMAQRPIETVTLSARPDHDGTKTSTKTQ